MTEKVPKWRKFTCAECGKPCSRATCRQCTNIRINKARAKPKVFRVKRAYVRRYAHTLAKQHRVITPDVTGLAWWCNLSREEFNEQIAKRVHDREQQMGTNYATPEYS